LIAIGEALKENRQGDSWTGCLGAEPGFNRETSPPHIWPSTGHATNTKPVLDAVHMPLPPSPIRY